MSKEKPSKPSNMEMQILSVLWGKGPLPVKDINPAMPDKKKRAYTTVLTLLQLMEKKGLVAHARDGVRHIYRAKKSRDHILEPFMNDLVSNVFGGNPLSAMQCLMDNQSFSSDEIAQIRKMLDDMEEN
jgi:BlaI family transcriptional regulator, penicillinase repressor